MIVKNFANELKLGNFFNDLTYLLFLFFKKMASFTKTGYQYKDDGRFSNDAILNAINNFVTLRKNDTKLSNAHLEMVIFCLF